MAPPLRTPSNRHQHICTPSSTHKHKEVSARALALAPPVSRITCPASRFPTVARRLPGRKVKDFNRVAPKHIRGTKSVKKYIAAGYRWNALRLKWRLNRPYRALHAHRDSSGALRYNVSPSARHQLPRVSTPESDLEAFQDDVDLLDSPCVERLARKSTSVVRKQEPRMFVLTKAPASLTNKLFREDSNVFFTKIAAPFRRLSGCARLVVRYDILARSSSLCRDISHDKRVGTLVDPTNVIVYDPAIASSKARNNKSSIQDSSIYIHGLLESDFAKAYECYDEVYALKSAVFWAGLTVFLDWARYDVIDFESSCEEDILAAYYVGRFFGAPEKYLLALDI